MPEATVAPVVPSPAAVKPAAVVPSASGTAPVPAPAAEAKPVESSPEEKVSAQRFAALVRKEKALNAERMKFKTEKEETTKANERIQKIDAYLTNANADPELAAKALWGDNWYEKLTDYKIAGKATPDLQVSSVRDELGRFKKQIEDERAAAAAEKSKSDEASRDQAIAEFRSSVTAYVKANAEEFELTNIEDGGPELVSAVIEKHFADTGQVLTNKDASIKVETFLEEKAKKLQAAKKFQAKAAQPPGALKQVGSAQPRTLTNDMTASTQAPSSSARTEKERMERALAALSR